MKKLMMILLVAVAVAMPSQAQVKFGLKGGLNLTNMTFSESGAKDAVKNKAGFFVGPTVKFTLPVVGLSLDAAALYDQRSAKYEGSNETLKTQSIQVPINVRYGVGLGSVVNLFAFAGPQFGFNVGDKHQSIVNDAMEWTLKGSNISANVGLGATLLDHLQVTVNYNIPLGKTGEVNVKDGVNAAWKTVTGGRSNAWQISAGYFF